MTTGLFYTHFAADPYFNMALDEWLLLRALALSPSVFLRLYTWRDKTITFGFNQDQATALDASRLGDTNLIRRVTGGRAICHDPSELTYALIVNTQSLSCPGLSGPLSRTIKRWALAMSEFLSLIGISSDLVRRSSGGSARGLRENTAPCFASSARYELLSDGRKIVASAQRRISSVLIQQGSIKLAGVASHPALALSDECITQDFPAISVAEFAQYAHLFSRVVGESLGLRFESADLTGYELEDLEKTRLRLKEKPAARRHITKQMRPANSHYGDGTGGKNQKIA